MGVVEEAWPLTSNIRTQVDPRRHYVLAPFSALERGSDLSKVRHLDGPGANEVLRL